MVTTRYICNTDRVLEGAEIPIYVARSLKQVQYAYSQVCITR